MISAARTMQPLPIRPIETIGVAPSAAPTIRPAAPMQPLPQPDRLSASRSLIDALHSVAALRRAPLPQTDRI